MNVQVEITTAMNMVYAPTILAPLPVDVRLDIEEMERGVKVQIYFIVFLNYLSPRYLIDVYNSGQKSGA